MALCVSSAWGRPAWAAAPSTSGRVVLDRVVAVVGDQIILWSELERATERYPPFQEAVMNLPKDASAADVRARREAVQGEVLDELIDVALIRAEAKKFDITVTEEDVDRASADVARQYGLSLEELREQVEQSDEYASWGEYRNELRDQILQFKVPHYLTTWSVSDAQVREHYRKLTKDETAKVKVLQFAFPPASAGDADRDKAIAQAQAFAKQLREGADPQAIAQEERWQDAERSIGRGDLAPALEDTLFAAEAGAIVGPLPGASGYLVFAVLEHQESAARSYDEAKEQIRAQLENEAFAKANIEMRQQLRAKAHIDVRL